MFVGVVVADGHIVNEVAAAQVGLGIPRATELDELTRRDRVESMRQIRLGGDRDDAGTTESLGTVLSVGSGCDLDVQVVGTIAEAVSYGLRNFSLARARAALVLEMRLSGN